jgi:cytochrome c oxidase subunit IV
MSSHVVPVKTYVAVFAALMVFTVLTVYAATHDFGAFNTPVALAIAFTKATLVVLYFMHVKYSDGLTKLWVFAGIAFLAILFLLTGSDYITRH